MNTKNRFNLKKSFIIKLLESSIWIYDKLNLRNFNIILNKQKVHLKLIGQYGVQTKVHITKKNFKNIYILKNRLKQCKL